MADFIGARFEAGCKASALASFCSAIAYGHRMRGLPDPSSDFRIRKLLAGARRIRPSRDGRPAITLDDLIRLCRALSVMDLSPVDKAAFQAIFPLAFFAMLRPGEVLLGDNPSHTLRVQAVSLRSDRLVVTVPSSKTSHSPFTTELVARPDLAICPVQALRQYLHIRPVGCSRDFLFVSGQSKPITTRQLIRTLRGAGRIAGLDVAKLTGHCFRIGGASYGAQLGMSELQLCEAGLWNSSAVRSYLRRPTSLLQLLP